MSRLDRKTTSAGIFALVGEVLERSMRLVSLSVSSWFPVVSQSPSPNGSNSDTVEEPQLNSSIRRE